MSRRLAVSRQYLQYFSRKKKLFTATQQFSAFYNEKLGCELDFRSLLPINGFTYHRNYLHRVFYSSKSFKDKPLSLDSLVNYENVSEETLQSLYDRFEEILQDSHFDDSDVNYSNGVLTITLEKSCVYVINKQTPNRQIWLSSPVSGPKRYDYVNGAWIYKHNGISLHQLLTDELSEMLQNKADFFNLYL